MKISELVQGLDVSLFYGKDTDDSTVSVKNITVDSREAGSDFIFAPILGYHLNGGEFVEDAYVRGCRVFLSETDAPPKNDTVIIKTKNIRKTLAEIVKRIYKLANKKVRIIGVTGTKGKTTIAFTLARLFYLYGISAVSIGTLGVVLGNGKQIKKTKNTTPEPTVLFKIIYECACQGTEMIVLEVSSQALKDFRVYGLEFEAVIFSSLGEDHIGSLEHESFTEYARAKRSLFTDYSANLRIFNADDKYTPYMAFGTEKCIKCGFSKNADYRISDFSLWSLGSRFFVNGVTVFSKMPAQYDAVNFSIALVTASKILDVELSELAPYLSEITVPGRYERYTVNGRTFIIDYAHNGISFSSVFGITKELYKGRIIAVFGSVGDRSRLRRRELARVSEQYADYSIITSDNPGYEPPEQICSEIYASFENKALCEISVDREKAILKAYALSGEGDVILLLGKGHEEQMWINGKDVPFSEKEIIKKLKNKG